MIFCLCSRILFVIIFYSDLLNADQRALTGSTVVFKCQYYAEGSNNLVWMYKKDQKRILLAENGNINNYTLQQDVSRRLSVSGNHANGVYHLHLADIRKSDEGNYECSVSPKLPIVIKLTVIVGPSSLTLENMTQDKKIPGIEGQNMSVKCTAEGGQPAPVVKLVILGIDYEGTSTAHHNFKPHSSMDGSTITCQAGYTDINYYPLNTTAFIHLMLKPVLNPFSPDILTTEETNSFDVSCQSSGSRPAASMYWLLGQQRIDVTSNSSTILYHDPSTDKYSVTSNLKYKVDRSYNGQKLICQAKNVAGSMDTSLTLVVKYAPEVTVDNITFSQTEAPREIHSTVESNPLVYTCSWKHKSKYGVTIRDFGTTNNTLMLPTVPKDQWYQDNGEYTCTAENGILGINGQLKQTGTGYVISEAPPVITADNKDYSTQYGKFGKSTKVNVNVYSIPKYVSTMWYIGNLQLVSDKYVTTEESTIVEDVFHGVDVQLDGYRITLTISDLQKTDFTNYTLHVCDGSQCVEHKVTLESASAPETPSNFTITDSGETSITVQWSPGYDGGQTQSFYIEYRITGSSKWMLHEIKISNQFDSYNLYTLPGLQDKTSYDLRMYAKNKFNQSQHTYTETIQTSEKATGLGGLIGGVAGGLVVVIVILVLIAFVLFKRKTGSGYTGKKTRSHSDSEFEEGLKDNVLYEGSDSINPGPNAEYAAVSKPAKKPNKPSNDEYAEVKKQNDVYAEVDKMVQQKNMKKKKQKEKKKSPKSEKTKGGAFNNNPDGEYANSEIPMGNMSDGAYSNAENKSAGNEKNYQGLEYADLTFGSKIPKGKQPVIHGDQNRTIYSEVDHTKKAPPPPQESEYEETDIRHGKK